MRPHLLFKKWKGPLFSRRRVSASFYLLIPLLSFCIGCGRTPCKETASNPAKNGVHGPIRSILLFMEGIKVDPSQPDDLHPHELREFDRQGHLTLLVTFGSDVKDSLGISRLSYNEKGLCVKAFNRTRGTDGRQKWTRIEYGYNASDTLLWQAEFGDTATLIPHTVIGYSSDRKDEADCIARWKEVRKLKIVYLDQRRVPLGEQWIMEGKSYGVIRYDTALVNIRGKEYTRYQLPSENINEDRQDYVANYYNGGGRLVEQWVYKVSDPAMARYSYGDLQFIQRLDSLGRQIAVLYVAGDTVNPLHLWMFDLDKSGNLSRTQMATYATFGAFLRGEATGEPIENRFEYAKVDKYDNWTIGLIRFGETEKKLGRLQRTLTYY